MRDRRSELIAAHRAEMNEPADKGTIHIISDEQIQKAKARYATLCAEYAACKGIYESYHEAGFEELAEAFATGATAAGEGVRAAAEMLDILGVRHGAVPQ